MTSVFYDFVIKGKLVLPDDVCRGRVAIAGGRIAKIVLNDSEYLPAREFRDVRDDVVFPGFVDTHVHFRTPGFEHKESWMSGSQAAVAGGVTTVIDMPNTEPMLIHTDGIQEKIRQAGKSFVDFGFNIGTISSKLDALKSIDASVVLSVKLFLAGHSTASHVIQRAEDLKYVFQIAANRGLLLTIHAEDQQALNYLSYKRPTLSLSDHEERHPRSAEVIAIGKVLELADKFKTQIHVVHVSSSEAVDLLVGAKSSGVPVTFEILGHHLSFNVDEASRLRAYGKLRPPIRRRSDQDRLWHALITGEASTVGSDHAPHTREEKEQQFDVAPPGIPGVQELIPSILTGLQKRFPQMGDRDRWLLLARIAAENPAQRFGLSHRKGAIRKGLDADLSVFAADQKWVLTRESIRAKCGWSAYEGVQFTGLPKMTVLRGNIVFENGRFGKPIGEWVGSIRKTMES